MFNRNLAKYKNDLDTEKNSKSKIWNDNRVKFNELLSVLYPIFQELESFTDNLFYKIEYDYEDPEYDDEEWDVIQEKADKSIDYLKNNYEKIISFRDKFDEIYYVHCLTLNNEMIDILFKIKEKLVRMAGDEDFILYLKNYKDRLDVNKRYEYYNMLVEIFNKKACIWNIARECAGLKGLVKMNMKKGKEPKQ